jgi:hypothetical protein
VYFTYLRYAESDKGGYQIEKLDLAIEGKAWNLLQSMFR